ncbi:MAG: hypothetical protein Q8M76_11195, partial [Spirochaetaceae bacterium]|nr:hypothetical protein [Spirochaetaceae bacterium]
SNSIGTDLVIKDNPSLAELPYMPLLANVQGSITIQGNGYVEFDGTAHGLAHLSVPGTAGFESLGSVSGSIVVEGNPNLQSAALNLSAPLILPASGSYTIRVADNDKLADLDGFFGPTGINKITDSNHNLEIVGNATLASIDSLGTSLIVGFSGVNISGNPLLADLDGLENINVIQGELRIEDSPALLALGPADFTYLRTLGSLYVNRNANLASADFGMLTGTTSMYVIDIEKNPTLASVSFPAQLGSVGGSITVAENVLGGGIALPGLGSTPNLTISKNTALASLSFPVLGSVAYNIAVNDNDALLSLDMPALSSVSYYDVSVDGNALLESIDLRGLTYVSRTLNIANNTALATLRLDALEWCTNLYIRNTALVGADLYYIDTEPNLSAPYFYFTNDPSILPSELEAWRTSPGRSVGTSDFDTSTGNGSGS